MIEVDFAELELMAYNIANISSGMDELYIHMKSLREEMALNPEFKAYPQCEIVIDSFTSALETVFRMNEMLMSLRNIMLNASDEYKIQEKRFSEMLEGCIIALSSLQMDVSAAALNVIPIEPDEEITAQNSIEQLVAESSSEMQLTNIAAVTQAVREEYCLDEVSTTSKTIKDIADSAEDSAFSSAFAEGVKSRSDDDTSQAESDKIIPTSPGLHS